MASATVPLPVLMEARDALDAFRSLSTYPAPTQAELFRLQQRAALAQGAIQHWIKEATREQRMEVSLC